MVFGIARIIILEYCSGHISVVEFLLRKAREPELERIVEKEFRLFWPLKPEEVFAGAPRLPVVAQASLAMAGMLRRW